ncbi:MAG: tetratricopeptide repeat protein [Elusimicrobia bacterium]|nr:tetratricopeptide repeat protein [Elusimicrobiota bacterium]MBI4218335.1 tetratricopeptide repeat protein [Elusimicrobiota bacterium]
MVQPLSSRQDLKIDPLQQWVQGALEWVAAHRQTFFSIVGTVAVVAGVTVFIFSNFRNLRKQAWERYAAGQNWSFSNQPDNGLNYFNEVINNYGHTPAAVFALLGKGDLLYRQGKFPEAVESYKRCLEKNSSKMILPFILAGMGASQEQMGDYSSSVATYRQFLSEFSEHYLSPKIHESLGRVYELSHNPDAAKEIYEKIITVFPGSSWAEKARVRYQTISPQPFQTPLPASTTPPPQTK